MIVIGLALVGGALTVLLPDLLPPGTVPDTFRPLDRYVGTEGSVIGVAFGLGVIWAAFRPAANRIWIHLAMLYGLLLLAREGILAMNAKPMSLGPIIFGLATLALLLALYPGFGKRQPVSAAAPPRGPAPGATPTPPAAAETPTPTMTSTPAPPPAAAADESAPASTS